MLQKNLDQKTDFYIDGAWRAPIEAKTIEVINPANEKPYAVISAGSAKTSTWRSQPHARLFRPGAKPRRKNASVTSDG
ncbi:hypothetical protein HED54_16450 [Ochrobactrum anthropi ATCC 49188]|nr:hypothetical protein [Brucella anthropi ATCC 49188]